MKRTYISSIAPEGKYLIEGFVHALRLQSKVVFAEIRDVTGIIQIVITHENPEAFETVKNLKLESVIRIVGQSQESGSNSFGLEVLAEQVEILTSPIESLPIQVNEKSNSEADLEGRMNHRWLDLRKPKKKLIFEVWTTMEQAFERYLVENNFIKIYSPKLLGTPSEGAAELFELDYFGQKAYLAQSPQFYKQMAMASGFEKVFEIGPAFRANPSFTVRHDTEFTMYDVEVSNISSHEEIMKLEEEVIKSILKELIEKHGESIYQNYGRELVQPEGKFPRMTLEQAKVILKELNIKSEKEGDLNPAEEKELCKYVWKKFKCEFVFVTDYPVETRPFYHMRHESNSKLTKSYDLLWNGHEITTGAQREHRYEVLVKQALEKGLSLEPLKHYLEFFKYGCPSHGGFGLGPTRMLMKIFGLSNVREVTFLYRGPKRLTP